MRLRRAESGRIARDRVAASQLYCLERKRPQRKNPRKNASGTSRRPRNLFVPPLRIAIQEDSAARICNGCG